MAETDSASGARTDHQAKRERLLALLGERAGAALVLTSQTSLAWYLEGARCHVNLSAPPIIALAVSEAGDDLWLTSNEVERLQAEELPSWLRVHPVRWDRPIDPSPECDPAKVLHEDDVAAELRRLRSPLLPAETARFAALGAEVAGVLTDVVSLASPTDREQDLAARVAAGLVGIGADPMVVLVGGAARVGYRHPLPTNSPLGRRAMVVVCARRHGLIANATRWIRFGAASAEEQSADERILAVEADFLAATRPGRLLGEVFTDAVTAYSRHGFQAEEWTRHHQGGVAGYAGRDPRATAEAADLVSADQAFAWNPSALGCKVEDTLLLTSHGWQVLTEDPRWPWIEVSGMRRPTVLDLG